VTKEGKALHIMAREVREALQPLTNSQLGATGSSFQSNGTRVAFFGRDSLELAPCYRCGQKGHVQEDAEPLPLPPLKPIALNNRETAVEEPEAITQQQPHPVFDALIAEANGCVAYLNCHPRFALLDTGNHVTSLSEHFYLKHLSDRPMRPLDGLVSVVRAAGQEVTFLGYVKLGVSFPRTETGTDEVIQTMVLVVSDNQFNRHVPLILGTNLAKQCSDDCQQKGGPAFLQMTAVSGAVEACLWCS